MSDFCGSQCKKQTLQVSRISRETHAFGPIFCVSRRETQNLTPISYIGPEDNFSHISGSTVPTETVYLSKFAEFHKESNQHIFKIICSKSTLKCFSLVPEGGPVCVTLSPE